MKYVSTLTSEQKIFFMKEAIEEANKARMLGEVPIGAVIVHDGKIIGRGHNLRESKQDATTHAEIMAIQMACRNKKNWRLENTQIFVTLEPCPMCSGGLILARVEEVYYGASDPKAGTAGSLMNLLNDERFNHCCYVESGIMADECGSMLTDFFRNVRERKKKLRLEKNAEKF